MFAFRCARTGLYFPADYVEEWGRKYGIGLGPEPISEALTNRYDIPIAESRDDDTTMHPVGVCRSQVDLVDIPEEEYTAKQAVLAITDTDMRVRGQIMRGRQLLKSTKLRSRFPEAAAEADVKEAARLKALSPIPE